VLKSQPDETKGEILPLTDFLLVSSAHPMIWRRQKQQKKKQGSGG
jgi:hypothetical protein